VELAVVVLLAAVAERVAIELLLELLVVELLRKVNYR
jgi:hypothetical protein